jgi:hypothetical protein
MDRYTKTLMMMMMMMMMMYPKMYPPTSLTFKHEQLLAKPGHVTLLTKVKLLAVE